MVHGCANDTQNEVYNTVDEETKTFYSHAKALFNEVSANICASAATIHANASTSANPSPAIKSAGSPISLIYLAK